LNGKTIFSLFGLLILLASCSYQSLAQIDDRDLENRIFNLGILRKGKSENRTGPKRDPKVLLAEVQDDFTKLQMANNDLAVANEKSQNLELQFVETSVKEIRFRAERLMENLTESKSKTKEATTFPADQSQLKTLISALDTVVGEFAHNRVFKEASPEDDMLAKKALKDLDQIIQLTIQLLKGLEILKK
jgi:hypothetical protein